MTVSVEYQYVPTQIPEGVTPHGQDECSKLFEHHVVVLIENSPAPLLVSKIFQQMASTAMEMGFVRHEHFRIKRPQYVSDPSKTALPSFHQLKSQIPTRCAIAIRFMLKQDAMLFMLRFNPAE